MSKIGEKRGKDEALSEIEEPPKKNTKTSSSGDVSDESDIHICDLSKNRKVSVRNWQGKIVVDIREFYVKDGKEFPGKKA
ncbi:RNA polymerase II transcriptional coactivator KIWI [Dorcoceras hygrometricum]|uniref:RNA polymerase II transcriptional coactivator KIWI n=1 Tax=Dorcoceras hygrometricum TaxID=472368 RepID=A0A2Z7AIW6_9LAMI|nr:RNA polymerase II transcriptional coactivator KIWI [Dorcoceras hygrometricum]